MKLPIELETQYVKDVLYNTSLKDLPEEVWKLIEGFENYAVSNYGRVKSLERLTLISNGRPGKIEPELIMKLIFVKQFNNYLKSNIYNVHCGLSLYGQKYRKSVARLVYYHFVEKFDVSDRTIAIVSKDDNGLHVHSGNLEKISARERSAKIYQKNRARNRDVIYQQPVSQYSVEGELICNFESMYAAKKALDIGCESIMDVINKEFLTAGGFRWFLQSYIPKKEDFIVITKSKISDRRLNTSLWEKLGKPPIDESNPPACMNLSLEDLPGEYWKPIPGFEARFAISNKGRIKRLSGWTSIGRKIFLKEHILSQIMGPSGHTTYLFYCLLRENGKNKSVTVTRLLYYCFVKEFDLHSRTLVVVNQNEPFWNIDLSKLSLQPIYSVLKRGRDNKA
ncbi:hypothetical protein LF887_15185 [Chryseobacterium sp. MEBOG06]|uniref:NUMOD4 domain-containing protein n=1 Tax=Chryseobacterium sp. MEBOG06 TaxID=2879938 RepID=UPI001EFFC4AC|nr:NUMOD4 domain-containing protein [Chryseobacterium sp. MEBOG06]UKB82347.1 hypothetical protein LF887_15185 [Chryseobacterium sp. MEBOG06]